MVKEDNKEAETIIFKLAPILQKECNSGDQHMSWIEVAEHVYEQMADVGLLIGDFEEDE